MFLVVFLSVRVFFVFLVVSNKTYLYKLEFKINSRNKSIYASFYVSYYKLLYDNHLPSDRAEAWYAGRFLTEPALSGANGYTNDIFCKSLYDTYFQFTKSKAW